MTLSPFVLDGYDIILRILRILKDEKLMFPKEKLLLAVKILGRFFAFHKKKEEYAIARKKERKKREKKKGEKKKGDKFLTRTLIILPMLRLAGSATSFSLVAAFIPTTLLGGGSNRQPSCHRPSGLSLRNQTAKNHTFKMQQY